ncbi:hypothetical protein RCL1_000483 [Eukaryota sp. TZLM3-RCL]
MPPSSSADNIKVVIRVRPENQRELTGHYRTVVRVLDDRVICFDPDDAASTRRVLIPGDRRPKDSKFAFDRVYNSEATQLEVYEGTAKELINDIFQGFNATVFAYGATGAGKTHTMLGNESAGPGVMVHCINDLFKQMTEFKEENDVKLSLSYLEVYNETLKDLIHPENPGPLDIREDSEKGIIVSNLSVHYPNSADQVLGLLQKGNSNRSQCPTDANATSSRSHAVLQIIIETTHKASGTMTCKRVGKLSLIDLAGSERASRTKNQGSRLAEGACINKSLLALGSCINELVKGRSKSHVPYRNSKLTRLLKDSLGGNCKTVMISNISPSSDSFEDTHNTLKYANRAKNIRVRVSQNLLSVQKHISEYVQTLKEQQKLINDQRAEIQHLRAQLTSVDHSKMIDSLKSELEIVTLFKRKLTNLFTVVEDHYHKKESLKRRRRELDREVGRLSRLVSDYRQKKAELSLPNIEDPPSFCYALRYLPDLKEELVEVKLQFTNHQKLYESSIREVQTLTNEIRSKIVFNPDLIQFVEDYTRKKSLETQLNDEVNYRKFLQREIDSERRARLTLERDAKSLVKYFLKVMTEQASHLGLLDPNTDFDTEKTRLLSSYSVAVKIADIAVDAGFEQASSQLSSASGSTLMENKKCFRDHADTHRTP